MIFNAEGKDVSIPIIHGEYQSSQSIHMMHNIKGFGLWMVKSSCIHKYVLDVLTEYDICTNTNTSRILLLDTWKTKTKKSKRRELKRFRLELKRKTL